MNQSNGKTRYRAPLIGYADAQDPRFLELKKHAHSQHFTPQQLLEGAKTVVVYFIPFTKELVELNRKHAYIAPEWALAYVETNQLINDIAETVKEKLNTHAVQCASIAATHNFDEKTLMSYWSHRHVAYIAGLGSFGINNMLITRKGCAGRYGSFVIDYKLTPTQSQNIEYCLYKSEGRCGACVHQCPTGALQFDGFDRHKCYAYLLEVAEHYRDMNALCDVCGKCDNATCAVWEK